MAWLILNESHPPPTHIRHVKQQWIRNYTKAWELAQKSLNQPKKQHEFNEKRLARLFATTGCILRGDLGTDLPNGRRQAGMNLQGGLSGRWRRESTEAEGLTRLHVGEIVLFVYLFCVCLCVCTCHRMEVRVRGQFVGVAFHLYYGVLVEVRSSALMAKSFTHRGISSAWIFTFLTFLQERLKHPM